MRCTSFCNPLRLLLVLLVGLHAQTSVGLRIDHKAGQAEVEGPLDHAPPAGESVDIDRLEYYMSIFRPDSRRRTADRH